MIFQLLCLSLLLPLTDAYAGRLPTTTPSSASSTLLVSSWNKLLQNKAGIFPTVQKSQQLTTKSFPYEDATMTYRYLPASPGRETDEPWVFIHPVGIGLASWFWEPLFQSLDSHPACYAINLLGCGIQDGSSPQSALAPQSIDEASKTPNRWVASVQHAIEREIMPRHTSMFFQRKSPSCHVIAQGGLAPIGIRIAEASPYVKSLVLTSPPSWKDLTTPVPRKELERNHQFLTRFSSLAFALLESKWAVEFFSNAFLFSKPCNEQWLDEAMKEACTDARPPVQVFNAGWCQKDACELPKNKPVLVLQGQDDTRTRDEYPCRIETLPGKNVLPWESPEFVARALETFLSRR